MKLFVLDELGGELQSRGDVLLSAPVFAADLV